MTRSVWRKRLKVIGLLLCLLMLALWVFSVMFATLYEPPNGKWRIGTAYGRISFVPSAQRDNPGWSCRLFYSEWIGSAEHMRWTQVAYLYLGFRLPSKYRKTFHIPAWLFVVATGFPTAILWWRDRRPKAGSCKACKYDLTGNLSGTCPECGTAVDASEHGAKPPRDGV